ncbi:MAG: SDR family oxidoreductase [Bdellovibrionota bacterium]
MKPLSQPNVLITGGTAGLGLALVEQFRRHGSRVATFARHVHQPIKTPELTVFNADVSKKDEIHSIAARAFEALGHIDVLVNNASSLGPTPLGPLLDLDCEDFESVLQVNLVGPFRLTKLIAADMLKRKRGLIVNVSSDAAINGYPGWGPYGASKAALDQMSRVLDAELSPHGVRSIAVDPGDMRTPLHFLAIPDANPEALKDPKISAAQILDLFPAFFGNPQPRYKL